MTRVVLSPNRGNAKRYGWSAFVDGSSESTARGRSLSEVRRNLRKALALPDGEAFEEEIRLPARFRSAVDRFTRARQREAELRAREAAAVRSVVEQTGLSLRDVGELVGLSAEGVRKLLAAS